MITTKISLFELCMAFADIKKTQIANHTKKTGLNSIDFVVLKKYIFFFILILPYHTISNGSSPRNSKGIRTLLADDFRVYRKNLLYFKSPATFGTRPRLLKF